VADAVDYSIVEILPPVVDRSVTIALITTRELVLKDFTFDPDYNKILKAADLIVQNLAGSLALVTCREPLKMQLTTNLKKTIQSQMNLAHFMTEGDSSLIPPLTEALI
jgi:CCR4-NOT transcription complex subunit 1